MSSCPVCGGRGEPFFDLSKQVRLFSRCPSCSLVYQESPLPDPDEERARYEQHNNDAADDGYRRWLLSFIKAAVTPNYEAGRILDYGSGPEPVLTRLLEEEGYPVSSYDPFFSPERPAGPFSLILLCEVLEHIYEPVEAFRHLAVEAEEGACLAVRTNFLISGEAEDFGGWWYKEDPTHVRFYSAESLRILGEKSGWRLEREDGRSLALFRLARD